MKYKERLVFHPDYTYSDFVGQIMPKINNKGDISYKFVPGPFTRLLKKAFYNPTKMHCLIIEEVNRGNAPAIFGDIFQLLDRDKYGRSEYEITNHDITKVLYNDKNRKIFIPSNMSIFCTMNTSDQNVFTLDTAFQRRWNMCLISNNFSDDDYEKELARTQILDTNITWKKFVEEINNLILDNNTSVMSIEDKRIGKHFLSKEHLDIKDKDDNEIDVQSKCFAEKVLKYLWDDAFKFNREKLFETDKVNSFEEVIEAFLKAKGIDRFATIFKPDIIEKLKS